MQHPTYPCTGAPASGHRAHFYEDESVLVEAIGGFLASGLLAGESILVVATPARCDSIRQQLTTRGFDTGGLDGRFTALDARETMARFMTGDLLDWERFRLAVGGELATSGKHVRVYGEMVDLLWADGKPQLAIELEEFWNQLARSHPFQLLCAYSMAHFLRQASGEWFRQVCDAHAGHELPQAQPTLDGVAVHDREVVSLQHRNRALEAEVRHRAELEEALRVALREQRRAEEERRAAHEALEKAEQQLRLAVEEQQRAAAGREALIAQLQAAVHFSEMFVGILGHDLRNPLMAITAAAGLISRRSSESLQLSRPLGRILTSADRMSRMIDQILDFTRLRLGKGFHLECRQADLGELLRAVVDELDTLDERGLVEVECVGDTTGCWDADRLSQLASNLVGNALQHRLPDSPVRIRIDGSSPERITFRVQNHGSVPPELLPALFEPFRDNGRKSAQSSGLGLGLFISRQIVEAHGGTIGVTSAEVPGTSFTVELPRG